MARRGSVWKLGCYFGCRAQRSAEYSIQSNLQIAESVWGKRSSLTPSNLLPISTRRMHRPLAVRADSSTHRSRNPGPNRGETAPKPLICFGVRTDAAERIFFETESGPTEASCDERDGCSLGHGIHRKHSLFE